MGGFEGGDEGGFWDIDDLLSSVDEQNDQKSKNHHQQSPKIEIDNAVYSAKAHAKVNLFHKVIEVKGSSFTCLSRFTRVENLYDTIRLVPCACATFTVEGCDNIPLKSNTIYKAYQALCDYTADSDIEEFFTTHKIVVDKCIPLSSGLSGSASDAAMFIHLVKEACNLVLNIDELVHIGSTIHSDIPFFIYNYTSANVLDSGEIVHVFKEEPLNLELHLLEMKYNTTLFLETFQKHFLATISSSSLQDFRESNSRDIFQNISNPLLLNDFYSTVLFLSPELKHKPKEGWFLSGSTFFKLKR